MGGNSNDIIKDIIDVFRPVDHSMSLNTLISVHLVLIFCLFMKVTSLIILTIFLYINLFIIYNKDKILNRVKNKYILKYVRYVLFKSRVDILVIGLMNIVFLLFINYILYNLIVHPIKI